MQREVENNLKENLKLDFMLRYLMGKDYSLTYKRSHRVGIIKHSQSIKKIHENELV